MGYSVVNRHPYLIILNPETGEVIDELYAGDAFRVVRAGERTPPGLAGEDTEGTSIIRRRKRAIYTDAGMSARVMSIVSVDEAWLLGRLTEYIGYADGTLKHKNGAPVSWKRVLELARERMGRNAAYAARSGLVSRGLIREKGGGRFVINPWVYGRGKNSPEWAYELFKDTEWAECE